MKSAERARRELIDHLRRINAREQMSPVGRLMADVKTKIKSALLKMQIHRN